MAVRARRRPWAWNYTPPARSVRTLDSFRSLAGGTLPDEILGVERNGLMAKTSRCRLIAQRALSGELRG
jgi:hypothetical protein